MLELNKLYLMDCMEGIKLIGDKQVDVSFTSPPYNRTRNDTYEHFSDIADDYFQDLVDITAEMLRVTKGYVIVNIQANMFNKADVYRWMGHYHDKINGVIVWAKSNPQPGTNIRGGQRSITNAFEYFVVMKDGQEFVAYGKDLFSNVITTAVNSERFNGHGAVMKKEVCDIMIRRLSKKGDLVLDPYMGMGSTAVSCYEQGRNYIGFEISEEYYKNACQRIAETKAQMRFDLGG